LESVKDESYFLLEAYGETAIYKMIENVARKAGIPEDEVSDHVLRRSGARFYLEAGGTIEEISAMLRHEDTRITMRYLGITMDHLRKLQERGTNAKTWSGRG
jgi:site-specific recombinase XerD